MSGLFRLFRVGTIAAGMFVFSSTTMAGVTLHVEIRGGHLVDRQIDVPPSAVLSDNTSTTEPGYPNIGTVKEAVYAAARSQGPGGSASVYASASQDEWAGTNGPNARAGAFGIVTFNDGIVVNSPGSAGQLGTLRFRAGVTASAIRVNGTTPQGFTFTPVAEASFVAQLISGTLGSETITNFDGNGDGVIGDLSDPNEYISHTIPIRFGEIISVSLQTSARANADVVGWSSVVSAIGWGGVLDVTDSGGSSLMGNFTISSNSGEDYKALRAPDPLEMVPEPGSIGFVFVTGCLAKGRRRRRSEASWSGKTIVNSVC